MAKETAIPQNEAVAPGGANMEQVLKALEELKKGIAEGDGGKREATEKKPPPDPAPVKMSKQKQTPVTPPPSPKVIMKTLRRQYQPVGAKETAKGCPASIPKKQTEPKQCKTPHKPAPVKGNAPEEKISGGIANRVAEIANMLNFHTQPD